MHNSRTNFGRFHRICKEFFESETDANGNFQHYRRKPAMPDLQVVALSCTMKALGIDSENLLWSKLKTDYQSLFPHLICRTRFNRRRRRLQPRIGQVQAKVAERLDAESEALVVDCIPVPVVRLVREKTYKVFKDCFDTAPAKGYSAVTRSWFIGYKLHIVIYDNGVVQQSGLTKGNVHDINFLKEVESLPPGTFLLGDKAYRSMPLQTDLFEKFAVKLKVPFRTNQHDYKRHPKKYRRTRQMVETFFAQMTDQFSVKRTMQRATRGCKQGFRQNSRPCRCSTGSTFKTDVNSHKSNMHLASNSTTR